jgi:hypothetical protein
MAEGLLAGKAVTYVLGFADVRDDLVVVNAGGLTDRFNPQTVAQVIETLRFDSIPR